MTKYCSKCIIHDQSPFPFQMQTTFTKKTRMHSSRMRTVRSSDRISGGGVCVCSRGCLLPGGSALWGVSAPRGGVCSGGLSALGVSAHGGLLRGVVSQHALRQTPPPPVWTDRRLSKHTPSQLRCGR